MPQPAYERDRQRLILLPREDIIDLLKEIEEQELYLHRNCDRLSPTMTKLKGKLEFILKK